MNRRDFLLVRTKGGERIAELSCEKLYMHFADMNSASKFGHNESGIADDAEWWSGEPSVVITNLDQNALFESMAGDIAEADVLLVSGRQWMVEGKFTEFVQDLFQQFSEKGGQIKYLKQ